MSKSILEYKGDLNTKTPIEPTTLFSPFLIWGLQGWAGGCTIFLPVRTITRFLRALETAGGGVDGLDALQELVGVHGLGRGRFEGCLDRLVD
ncbi:MAG: hypothetical protein OXC82_10545 [Rhodobacteraceae bacterium]|nr:hypothetical protein [Paracoccaceae bacterium]MCY4250854.1 hypothetical protein [Paracoccaceae bacterium]MCY4309560.1 hypothetical protein [Paracoccaceae bacterium]